MSKNRRGLGRGLDALLQSTQPPEPGDQTSRESGSDAVVLGVASSGATFELPIDAIRPNPYQPRQSFDQEALAELSASIREHGLIQPLLVKPEGDGYCLIAGERRWQAARQAGLEHVQVVVREATPQEMLALAIVENVQRADLDPIEAAAAYRRLMDEFDLTQAEVARLVGKSRTALANTVRLLTLSEDVQRLVSEGHLTEGHARALVPISDDGDQRDLARRAISQGWTVRRVEDAVRTIVRPGEPAASRARKVVSEALDPDTQAAVNALEEALGTRVEIRRRGEGGRLVLYFYSEEELSSLYARLIAKD